MTSAPLRHFVEEAFGRYAKNFGGHMPQAFDWLALCASAPYLVSRIDPEAVDPNDEAAAAPVRKRAFLYFQFGYLVAVSALSLRAPYPWAPEDVLETLMGEMDDEEEKAFASLCEHGIGAVERALATEDAVPELDDKLLDVAEIAWSAVLDLMAETLPAANDHQAVRAVCVGLARTAAIVASFRWIVGAPSGAA